MGYINIQLVDHTINPEDKIAAAASVSHDSACNRERNLKRIHHLIANKHLSVLRFAYATFLIDGLSRACSHQLVRTAHAGMVQQSQRYVECKDLNVVIPESIPNDSVAMWHINQVVNASRKCYEYLLSNGVEKEDARYFLLEGTTSKIIMTGNFQMWYEWIPKRTSDAAQAEIRNIADVIHKKLNNIAPNIFGGCSASYPT